MDYHHVSQTSYCSAVKNYGSYLKEYSKTCLKGPLKKDHKFVFKTKYYLMQVKSLAECSKRAFCNTFDLH